ncbi:unnamed protein product, partial [Amoebophrya sp. A25]
VSTLEEVRQLRLQDVHRFVRQRTPSTDDSSTGVERSSSYVYHNSHVGQNVEKYLEVEDL